jgi:hypothetical protein
VAPGQKVPTMSTATLYVNSPNFNVYLGARLTDTDPERAKVLGQDPTVPIRATRQSAEGKYS